MNVLNIEEDTRVGVNARLENGYTAAQTIELRVEYLMHGVKLYAIWQNMVSSSKAALCMVASRIREEGRTKKKMASKEATGQILERWQFEWVQGDTGRLTTCM